MELGIGAATTDPDSLGSHEPAWIPASQPALVALAIPRHPVFERMIAQVPAEIRMTFSAEQLIALSRASLPVSRRHALDYRVSFGFFGRRYYLTVLGGIERRSRERLLREGQLMLSRVTLAYSFMIGGFGAVAFAAAVLALYVVKSLLGIDVIEGPSALHDVYMAIEK